MQIDIISQMLPLTLTLKKDLGYIGTIAISASNYPRKHLKSVDRRFF